MRNFEFLNRGCNAVIKLQQRIDAWDETQRKLLLAGLILVASILSVGACFIPTHNQQTALIKQKEQLLTATQALQKVLNNNQPSEEETNQANATKTQRKLPVTRDFAEIFSNFIKKDPTLQLVQLTATPPIKLKEGDQDFLVDGKAVYRTELTLTISGNFYNLFSYLQQLEHMPWYFFWKSMTYQVSKYPDATLILTLQVLSLNAEKTA